MPETATTPRGSLPQAAAPVRPSEEPSRPGAHQTAMGAEKFPGKTATAPQMSASEDRRFQEASSGHGSGPDGGWRPDDRETLRRACYHCRSDRANQCPSDPLAGNRSGDRVPDGRLATTGAGLPMITASCALERPQSLPPTRSMGTVQPAWRQSAAMVYTSSGSQPASANIVERAAGRMPGRWSKQEG